METNLDEIIMNLVVEAGNARGLAIEAYRLARDGDFPSADKQMEEVEKAINQAHVSQTDLIQSEVNGGNVHVSLMLVHAQDHLMNAITVIDLVREMIDTLKKQAESL